MAEQVVLIEAFIATPFAGNSAAICLLERPRDATWIQRVAREFNLAATVFIASEAEEGRCHLRWFSPTVELALCGRDILANACLLWEDGHRRG